ncbi:MAG TPA: hypothetical protein VLS53_03985 [Candidatus Dormibacteraeota bacterium]|nr:hypothetical protein [Candidatus Dormibacteraeota bacterium]
MLPETPLKFERRADGFRHAARGGLWLAPLVYLEHARYGAGWYGKVVSSDRLKVLEWGRGRGIPERALEVKSMPDVDSGPRHDRRRIAGYHIDLWGPRLALAYDLLELASLRARSVSINRL